LEEDRAVRGGGLLLRVSFTRLDSTEKGSSEKKGGRRDILCIAKKSHLPTGGKTSEISPSLDRREERSFKKRELGKGT